MIRISCKEQIPVGKLVVCLDAINSSYRHYYIILEHEKDLSLKEDINKVALCSLKTKKKDSIDYNAMFRERSYGYNWYTYE